MERKISKVLALTLLIAGLVFSRAGAATIFGNQAGKFAGSNAVATNSSGDIYVFTGSGIIQFTNSGMYIKTFWDGGLWQGHSGFGMAADKNNNIYISKMNECAIVKINADGKDVPFSALGKNFIGSGKSGLGDNELQRPAYLCVDGAGAIYAADYTSVKKFNPDGLSSQDLGGHNFLGTPGQEGSDEKHFKNACGVAVDKDGNIYVVDSGNFRVMVYDKAGNLLRSIPDGYLKSAAPQKTDNGFLANPVSCAVDDAGNLYVAEFIWGDIKCRRIQKFSPAGSYICSNTGADLFPAGIYFDNKTGTLFATGIWNHAGGVMKYDKDLKYTGTVGAYPDQEGTFQGNAGIAIDENQALYICEPADNSRLQKISGKDGSFIKILAANRPQSVSVDNKAKVIYVMESNGKVRKLNFDLSDLPFDLKFEKPVAFCVGTDSSLYVSLDKKVYLLSADGKDKKVILDGIEGGISLDNQGNIYVADPWPNKSIHKFPPYQGKTLTPDDRLWTYEVGSFPGAPVFDAKGNLIIALGYSSRLVVLSPDGKLITVNGKKYFGEWGGIDLQDGYHLDAPSGLAVFGNILYVSDSHGIIKYNLKYNPDGSLEIIP